jgi:hypothetical protein
MPNGRNVTLSVTFGWTFSVSLQTYMQMTVTRTLGPHISNDLPLEVQFIFVLTKSIFTKLDKPTKQLAHNTNKSLQQNIDTMKFVSILAVASTMFGLANGQASLTQKWNISEDASFDYSSLSFKLGYTVSDFVSETVEIQYLAPLSSAIALL